jgi:hypothetical protein
VQIRGVTCTRVKGKLTERVQELRPVFAFDDDDFTAGTAHIRVNVEHLPEMINRAETRCGTDVEEDTNVGLKNRAKCIEEPAVRVDPILGFLLQAKNDLRGDNTSLRTFYLVRRGDGYCRGRKIC